MFDVLVAGAGPAGAIAATVLARAGARVLVVDRARFPRDKLCGDTVNPGALAVLRRLGLASAARGLPVDGMVLTGEPSIRVEGRYPGVQGQAVVRRDLDSALLEAARAAGARVDEGVLVTGPVVESSGAAPAVTGLMIKAADGRSQPIPAKIVIAADGRYSRVARALGLSRAAGRPRRWAVGAYFQDVAGLTSFGEMHVRRGHYLGVAPLSGGIANACVVTSDRSKLGNPSALVLGALRADCQLADRFARATMIAPAVSLGPLAVECAVAGMPGLLLAGDAAGFVDPMTGDGLRFAFRGGELAAQAALAGLETGPADAHLRLLAARRREFSNKWRFNRGVRAIVDSHAAVQVGAFAAVWTPALLARVIRYAGDV